MISDAICIIPVDDSNVGLYISYAKAHGRKHDESYLPGESFLPDNEHPAFLLAAIEESSAGPESYQILGACGLMLEKPYLAEGRGRFTIIHAESGDESRYRMLRDAAIAAAKESGLSGGILYGFMPSNLTDTAQSLRNLGWYEERRTWLLINDNPSVPDDRPPEGYFWSTVRAKDTGALEKWRNLINVNFADVAGHVELTSEKAIEYAAMESNINAGLDMLNSPEGPVGTMQAEVDEDNPDGSFLGAISLNDSLRGRGLGRLILRRGLALSRRAGLNPTWLTVNAENENAVRLYRSEGFRDEKVMVCLSLKVD